MNITFKLNSKHITTVCTLCISSDEVCKCVSSWNDHEWYALNIAGEVNFKSNQRCLPWL